MSKYRYFMFERIMYAVLLALLGALFIYLPAESGITMSIFTGITLLAVGMGCFCANITFRPLPLPIFVIFGTLLTLCGVMCLIHPIMFLQSISIMLGVLLFVDGEVVLYDGIRCALKGIKGGWWLVILSLPIVVLGIFILFCHFTSTVRMVGAALIAAAVINIIITCAFGHHIHKMRNELYKN